MKFILSEPVYETSCTFLINEPLEAVKVLAQKNATKKNYEKTYWIDFEKNQGTYFSFLQELDKEFRILHIPKFSWTVKDMAILGHEIAHLIFAIMSYKEIPIKIENDETFCYLFEYYLRGAFDKLKPKKK